jgi:iron-sulfur cluster assembly accessory protein
LEAGVLGHGFSEEALERLLEKLNAIVLQEQDLSTIEMTPRAAQKYMAILAEEGKEGWGVRLDEKAAGCNGFEFVLDYSESPAEDDVVYESQGIQIHIRRSAEDRMLGTEIDFIDGLHGSGFKVSNPNVRSSCGCGTSHNY